MAVLQRLHRYDKAGMKAASVLHIASPRLGGELCLVEGIRRKHSVEHCGQGKQHLQLT